MLFWIVVGALAALVAGLVARPLLPAPPAAPAPSPDVALYRDQLAEVERDLARGTLPPEEAARARAEVARRLLAADRAGPRPERAPPRGTSLLGVGAVAAVLVMGSLALYAALGTPGAADAPRAARIAAAEAARAARPSQAEAERRAAALLPPPAEAPSEYRAMVAQVREAVAERTDDLRGWELLAMHEARLGRYAEAARAQGRVVALKGEGATAAEYLGLVDRMVAAAGGLVSPEAEGPLARVAALDPASAGGRYYAGLVHAQTGRPDLAFPLWRAVVAEAPADSLHRRLAEQQIAEVAWLAGADWEQPPPGPSAEDLAAAAALDPDARAAMVQGMVEGLGERLAAEGGPPEDWARLVTSLAVLGDGQGAAAALAWARAAHGGDAAAMALLDRAAVEAGVEG